jgi:hypothetical protein
MTIKVYAGTNYVGSTVEDELEIPDEELEGLTEQEQEKHLEETAHEWMIGVVDWGWYKINPEDD